MKNEKGKMSKGKKDVLPCVDKGFRHVSFLVARI